MELTQDEMLWLFENIGEVVNKVTESLKDLAKAIEKAIDDTIILLSSILEVVDERKKANESKNILKKFSPKYFCKKIKQFMKRKV